LHTSQEIWRASCAVIIPCLNEGDTIGSLVHEVRNYLPNVLVVDDGSSDNTAAIAASAGAQILAPGHSSGKGAALMSGFRLAVEKGFTWALTMDGDGQHAATDIPKFLAAADPNAPALLVGNRMHDASRMPWLRRKVNRWMSARLSRRLHLDLPDSQCGFRLFHLSSMLAVGLSTQRFQIESEMLVGAARQKIPISFVPIEVIYRGQRSKINPVTDTILWFRWFWASRR